MKNNAPRVWDSLIPHETETPGELREPDNLSSGTNGGTKSQTRRIADSGMAKYFDRVFISEQMGCKKPDKLFYDKVFAEIGEDYRAQSIMIGDSLSSDMQGGRNAGIPTCLYGRTEPISPLCDYAVADLLELPALLAPL